MSAYQNQPPQLAFAALQDSPDAVLIDCRTREDRGGGHPPRGGRRSKLEKQPALDCGSSELQGDGLQETLSDLSTKVLASSLRRPVPFS